MPDIRVLVADDYPGQNLATRDLSIPEMCKIIIRTETTDDTLKEAEKLLPDIVLLDSHMPGLLSGTELTRKLSQLRRVKVVVLSESRKLSLIKDFFDAGARAYMLKTDPPALVRMTIFLVSRGGKDILSPDLPRSVLKLDDQDCALLRHVARRGRLAKTAQRLGFTEAELHDKLIEIAGKLELADSLQVIKWAKKNGYGE